MTREEKKAKLNSIHIVVTDIIATCDMGLEFTTMTAKGVTTQMGNVFQWPCFVFNNEEKQMQQILVGGNANNRLRSIQWRVSNF